MEKFEAQALHSYAMGSPRADQLLTLIHFNVLRALMSNTVALDFGDEWFLSEDAISPFFKPQHNTQKRLSGPSSLRPSPLQRTVEHHPWIDLFPIPELRDNFLRANNSFDEWDLCNELVDFHNLSHDRTGLIVWATPWDISGWEVSEAFARKWPWLVKGCNGLLASTNYWRAKRGEAAIEAKAFMS